VKGGPLVPRWAAGRGLFPHPEAVSKPPASPLFFVSIFAAGALTSEPATRLHSHPILQIYDAMAKAKLKKILDVRQGRDIALEKQRKKEKAAEKRKAKNAPAVEDDDEAGGVPLDEVEVKVNGKAKESKNGKKAAKVTEKEAEWETEGSQDEEDDSEDEDDMEERPAFDLSRLEDSESDVSGDDEEDDEEEDEDDEEAEDIPLSDIESLASHSSPAPDNQQHSRPHRRPETHRTSVLEARLLRAPVSHHNRACRDRRCRRRPQPRACVLQAVLVFGQGCARQAKEGGCVVLATGRLLRRDGQERRTHGQDQAEADRRGGRQEGVC
jgi:hypothetical protein